MGDKLTEKGELVTEVKLEKEPISQVLSRRTKEYFIGTKKEVKKEEEKKEEKNPLKAGKPLSRNHIILESMQGNIEVHYYWFLKFFEETGDQYGAGFAPGAYLDPKGGYKDEGAVIKVRDLYTSSEASSYWGNIEARRAAQQDKFAQYMVNIGQMVKSIFPMIRELRLIDERIQYFDQSKAGDKDAEVALKTIWTDQVEGGTKAPTSLFALAGQPGYSTLPDLFFAVAPKSSKDIDKELDKIKNEYGLNVRVLNILGNKLKQYLIWKENVEGEFRQRKKFMVRYLNQHYHVIKLYLNWLRPYLVNIKSLQMESTMNDPDLAKAFDSGKIELELLGRLDSTWVKLDEAGKEKNLHFADLHEHFKFEMYHPCVLIKIKHLTLPSMAFQQEGSRGPIHTGSTDIIMESYVATKDEIKDYQTYKDVEDLKLIELVNHSIKALEDDLVKYLKEAEQEVKVEKKEEKVEQEGIFEPFKALFHGFKDLVPTKSKPEGQKKSEKELAIEKKVAEGLAKEKLGRTYMIFKLTHGMFVD